MERINGIRYYYLDDIIKILRDDYGIKKVGEGKYNKVIQFFNERSIPYSNSKDTIELKLYSEDIVNDIIDYFYKNQKIEEYKNKIAELKKELKELNTKYPVIKNIKK